MAKPGTASIYVVGAALLGVFALAAWGVLGASSDGGTEKKLVLAAKRCGFENPRFMLKDGTWLLNETEVTGRPNPPLTPQQVKNWQRHGLVRTKWMPCLQQQAKAMGVRVNYEKMVIVN